MSKLVEQFQVVATGHLLPLAVVDDIGRNYGGASAPQSASQLAGIVRNAYDAGLQDLEPQGFTVEERIADDGKKTHAVVGVETQNTYGGLRKSFIAGSKGNAEHMKASVELAYTTAQMDKKHGKQLTSIA